MTYYIVQTQRANELSTYHVVTDKKKAIDMTKHYIQILNYKMKNGDYADWFESKLSIEAISRLCAEYQINLIIYN